MSHRLTWGDLRKLVAENTDKADASSVIMQVDYGDVCHDGVFVRVDYFNVSDEKGYDLHLTMSLVDEDDIAEEEDDQTDPDFHDRLGNQGD